MFRISGPWLRPLASRRQTRPARRARRLAIGGVSRRQAATPLDHVPPPPAWHRSANFSQILKHSPRAGPMTFYQFMSGTFGNVALGTQSTCSPGDLQDGVPRAIGATVKGSFRGLWGRNRPGAGHVWGEYYVISLESEDMNMSIRAKSIVTTLALTLIATAPAWSQSLLKRLDPDNDGTIDL